MRKTTIYLDKLDDAIIKKIKIRTGAANNTAAIRIALRAYGLAAADSALPKQ